MNETYNQYFKNEAHNPCIQNETAPLYYGGGLWTGLPHEYKADPPCCGDQDIVRLVRGKVES